MPQPPPLLQLPPPCEAAAPPNEAAAKDELIIEINEQAKIWHLLSMESIENRKHENITEFFFRCHRQRLARHVASRCKEQVVIQVLFICLLERHGQLLISFFPESRARYIVFFFKCCACACARALREQAARTTQPPLPSPLSSRPPLPSPRAH